MLHFISPNFTHNKLEPPLYRDIVDVFEDRMRNWLIVPAKELLNIRHGAIAAVALVTNYFEGIEIYLSGKDSKGKSRAFFQRGFNRVFTLKPGNSCLNKKIADLLYDFLRCGFAHDALFRNPILFSEARPEAISISWPRKNDQFDPHGTFTAAVINSTRFVECIEVHFDSYLARLRMKKDTPEKARFKAAVDLKWRLNEPGPTIGLSEEQFTAKD